MTPLIIASILTLTLSLAIAYWFIFGKHYEPAEIEHYPNPDDYRGDRFRRWGEYADQEDGE